MDALQRGIVVAHGHAVTRGPNVELEPVAAGNGERGTECRKGVLGGVPPVTAMGESDGADGLGRRALGTAARAVDPVAAGTMPAPPSGHPTVSRAASPR